MTSYPSALLERAVGEVRRLPGIGKRTALRLVLHLLRQEESQTEALADSLVTLRRDVHYCRLCHNICDDELCDICANTSRDGSLVCVVENIQDVMAIENTQQYRGLYHVLGGIISPMEGVGPADLEIQISCAFLGIGCIDCIVFFKHLVVFPKYGLTVYTKTGKIVSVGKMLRHGHRVPDVFFNFRKIFKTCVFCSFRHGMSPDRVRDPENGVRCDPEREH